MTALVRFLYRLLVSVEKESLRDEESHLTYAMRVISIGRSVQQSNERGSPDAVGVVE